MSRIEKVNELIKQEIGKIILENLEFDEGVFVTILDVKTSDSMEHAKISISVFPDNFSGSVLEKLNKEIAHLQKLLNRKLAMRFVPKISFEVIKGVEKMETIEKLLEEI